MFKTGDEVLIIKGPFAGMTGKVLRKTVKGKHRTYAVATEEYLLGANIKESHLELVDPCYYARCNITTVAAVRESEDNIAMRIEVTPNTLKSDIPYFKVLDCCSTMKKKHKKYKRKKYRACRLHFKDEGMEYNTGDEVEDWKTTEEDIGQIKWFLNQKNADSPEYTNWQMTCWTWNYEYGQFFTCNVRDDRIKYFGGGFDEEFKDHPSYVPHDQPMPGTWHYRPPK